MNGFERYQSAMLNAMSASIKPLMKNRQHTKSVGEALWNHLFDLPGPRQVSGQPTQSQIYVGRVFGGFVEIFRSLETLQDIRSLVGRPPERRPQISEDRYLQVLVEAYLNELYLLRERLKRYAKSIQRAFGRDTRSSEVRTKTTALITAVDAALEPFLQTRNLHTHKERFSDEGISRLGLIKLLMLSDDPRFETVMQNHYRVEQARVKKRWRSAMKAINKGVRQTTSTFFEGLFPLVFNKDTGQLLFPIGLRIPR